jgi:hypothetical protein
LIAVITALCEQIKTLQGQGEHFGWRPDAGIYLSQPSTGGILGARVLGGSGDGPTRYASPNACKNFAVTSPVTRALGNMNVVAV